MAGAVSFSGMASGLDTDAIVEAMTSNYQSKVDKSQKQEILMEWQQEAYKEVSNKVYEFYTGTLNKLRLESTFNQKLLTTSQSNGVQLDPSSTVPTGTHTLSDLKLATSARVQTVKIPKGPEKINTHTTLAELGIKAGESITITDQGSEKTTTISFVKEKPETQAKDTIYILVNEEDATEEKKTGDTIGTLQSALKSAMPSGSVSFSQGAGAFFIASNQTGSSQGYEFTGNASALYKLGLINQSSYEEAVIVKDDKGQPLLDEGGQIKKDETQHHTFCAEGMNGSYNYNGIEIETENNNVNINGLKFTMTANTTGDPITITSSPNTEGIVETVKSFVEEYNTLLKELGDLVNADSAGNYEPLLDEEKEGMTDSQIEKWEDKIKGSLLRNDSTLKNLISTMRGVVTGTLEGNSKYSSLTSIGITTSSDWTQNGKLELNEEKLREALAENPDEVVALFTSNGEKEASGAVKKGTLGIGDNLYEALGENFKRIANVKSSTSLFNDTQFMKKRTEQTEVTHKWEDRLEKMKAIYYTKFTAMEKMMSTLNSQSESLASLLTT